MKEFGQAMVKERSAIAKERSVIAEKEQIRLGMVQFELAKKRS
jgi:hypothetical protein